MFELLVFIEVLTIMTISLYIFAIKKQNEATIFESVKIHQNTSHVFGFKYGRVSVHLYANVVREIIIIPNTLYVYSVQV